MTVETIRQFIEWTHQFHEQLAICMRECAKHNGDDRAQMQLNYISRHEKQLGEVMEAYTESDFDNALNTWVNEYFQKSPLRDHQHECQGDYINDDSDRVLSKYIEKSNQVIHLFKMLAEKADPPSSKALLEQLTKLQEQHVRQVVQGSNRMHDM